MRQRPSGDGHDRADVRRYALAPPGPQLRRCGGPPVPGLDGTLTASTATNDDPGPAGNGLPVTIGDDAVYTSPIASRIDDVLIYDRALSEAELAQYLARHPVPRPTTTSLLTTGFSDKGFIAITTDGNPLVAYGGGSGRQQRMNITRCVDPACISVDRQTHGGGVVWSIVVPPDARPIVAAQYNGLELLRCVNPTCASGSVSTDVDTASGSGNHARIAIGRDGFPILAYYQAGAEDLKLAKCHEEDCSTPPTINTVDTTGHVGESPSIVIGGDGLPLIAYYDYDNHRLKVTKCANLDCSALSSTHVVDEFTAWSGLSVALGRDGLPIIAFRAQEPYMQPTTQGLRVVKCGDPACGSGNVSTWVDTTGLCGASASIAVPADGRPVISYFQNYGFALKVAKCGNEACSQDNSLTTIYDSDEVGPATEIAIGADGLPVIAYTDRTHSGVKVAKCGSPSCSLD